VHRLATGDARRLDLHAALDGADDGSLAIDGLTEGVHDATEQCVTDRHREDATGGPHRRSLLDCGGMLGIADDHGADGVLVEVQGETDGAALELEELVDADVGKARHAGDTVAHLEHPTDLRRFERGVVSRQVLLEGGGDVAGVDGEFSHYRFL